MTAVVGNAGSSATELRPRLRGDVYVMRVAEGAYIRSNLGGSMLKGAATYEWIQRIAPLLDGTRTLDELCAGVPEQSRAALAKLITLLHGKGYVKNVLDDRAHTLSPELTSAYAANIAFIEYFTDSPELRFEQYRNSSIVLAGAGPLLQALTNSQLRAGVRTSTLAPFGESPVDGARIAEHLAVAQAQDPAQEVTFLDRRDAPLAEQVAGLAAGADIVLHVADRPMIDRARLISGAARAAGASSAQAVVAGDDAWIGPVTGPEGDPSAWESAWRRLVALAPDTVGADLQDHREVEPTEFLRGPTVALVANQLCFAAFRHLTGIEQGLRTDAITRFDLETLETDEHTYLPHPLARPATADDPARFAALASVPAVDDVELSRRAVAAVDPHTGVFAEITERDYEQLPLFVSEVVVSDPTGHAGGPFPVFGSGDDVIASRQAAIRRAFEGYASVMADPRRGDTLFGADALTGEPVAVAFDAVFPDGTAQGVASGPDWAGASRAAVVAAARQNVIAGVDGATGPFPEIDVRSAASTPRGGRYLKLLDLVEQPVQVHDVSSLAGVPAFAFSTSTGTVAYAADLDPALALEQGLQQALLAYQAVAAEQPAYAPAPVPELRADQRGAAGEPPATTTLAAAVGALAGAAGRVVIVPLDHDAAVARLCPFVVRAVVVDG